MRIAPCRERHADHCTKTHMSTSRVRSLTIDSTMRTRRALDKIDASRIRVVKNVSATGTKRRSQPLLAP